MASESFLRISKTRASCLSMSSFEIVVDAMRGCSGLMNKAGSASGFVCNTSCNIIFQSTMRLKITEKVTFHIIESEVQIKCKKGSILTSFGKPKAYD